MVNQTEFYAKEITYYLWQLELLEKSKRDRKEEIQTVNSYLDHLFSMF